MVVVSASLLAALAVFVISRAGPEHGPAFVSVYNLEAQCQTPRTDNCRLGLARDPYTRYTRPNVIAHVWHGDRLRVDCFIPDGAQVRAEDGTTSTRWYRVSMPHDSDAPPETRAWLTAIRVRPGTAPTTVPRCTDV